MTSVHTPARSSVACLLALVGVCAPVQAQDQPGATPLPWPAEPDEALPSSGTPGLDRVIARLDAPSLAARNAASAELRLLFHAAELVPAPTPVAMVEAAIARAIARPDLTREQEVRLTACLRERFFSSRRAAMGIQFGPVLGTGVAINAVFPGFPAKDQNLLQPGDVVVSMEGLPLIDRADEVAMSTFRRMVVSRDPGDVLRLVIRRPMGPINPGLPGAVPNPAQPDIQGEFVELDLVVPLGSFDALPQQTTIEPQVMQQAWQLRLERMGLGGSRVPVLSDDGASTDDHLVRIADQTRRGRPELIAAGTPTHMIPGAGDGQWQFAVGADRPGFAPNPLAEQEQQLQLELARLRRMAQQNLEPANQRALAQRIANIENELRQVSQFLDAVRQQELQRRIRPKRP